MKRVGLGVSFFFFLISVPSLGAQIDKGWAEIRGKHFILYHQGADPKFPDHVLDRAEAYYDKIAASLGYSRRNDFWLWDRRCLIYLYPSSEEFRAETRQSRWSNGFAIPSQRTIVSYQGAHEFLDSILPHELAHLIFRDFVGTRNGKVPLWLEEGLAMAQEEGRRAEFDRLVSKMISEKKWIPVGALSQIRSLKGFSPEQSAVFYAEAQSLVRFLLDFGGPGRFVQFCRDLRDGEPLDLALRKNYPRDFPTIEAFENQWASSHA